MRYLVHKKKSPAALFQTSAPSHRPTVRLLPATSWSLCRLKPDRLLAVAAASLTLAACGAQESGERGAFAANAETADAFVARVNRELEMLDRDLQAAGFTQSTFITADTEQLNARATERYLAYLSQAVEESKRYEAQNLSPATARAIKLLKQNVAAPAPPDPAKR